MFNYAVYASRQDDANHRDARRVQLDENGNVTNHGPHGQAWGYKAVWAAQEKLQYEIYQAMMIDLEALTSIEDTHINNALAAYKAKARESESSLEALLTRFQEMSSEKPKALIAYAAVWMLLYPYKFVDFGWLASADEAAAEILTGGSSIGETIELHNGSIADYEGYAVSYEVNASFPATIKDEQGRTLERTARGWRAESKSQPGMWHEADSDGSYCSCKGFTHWSKCWHTALVRSQMAQI